MVVFLIAGISAYASRVPERIFPKKFDIFVKTLIIFRSIVTLYGIFL